MRSHAVLLSSACVAAIFYGACNASIPDDELGSSSGNSSSSSGAFGGEGKVEGLVLDPGTATLDITGPGSTITFTVTDIATGQAVTGAAWSVDNENAGTITDGTFTASGVVGTQIRVYAAANGKLGSAVLTLNLKRTENVANLSDAKIAQLRGGGTADAAFKWLYPYDRTVFPRGLMAPTLQFAGTAAEAYRVFVKGKYVEYELFVAGGAGPMRIPLTEAQWTSITQSTSGTDRPTISVTKIAGANVAGPISETWTIAQGTLKGVVYYNSYNSTMAREGDTTTDYGAVLRIKPGTKAEVFLGGKSKGCTVCHSVSANGNVLVAVTEKKSGTAAYWGETWSTPSETQTKTRVRSEQTANFNWGALNPDGSMLLTSATVPQLAGQDWAPNVPGVERVDQATRLLDPKTGAVLTSPGLPTGLYALMPMFSPEGRRVAFSRLNKTTKQNRVLSIMDFDPATRTFSGLSDLYTDAQRQVTWPAFLPGTGDWIVLGLDTSLENATRRGAKSQLAIVNAKSKTKANLDQANGIFNGTPYTPYTDDLDLNYEPTVLPQPVGGYYWVVFTSRRKYGNTITSASQEDAPRKKLWVSALDVSSGELGGSDAARDISNPAFYLSEQELEAGNMRAFWSLDQCKPLATECRPGKDDCCGGFCRLDATSGTNKCVGSKNDCSKENETCATDADCCGGTCLNGKCLTSTPR